MFLFNDNFQLPRPKNAQRDEGFTLLEVLVAIIVLTIGLMSAALLMSTIYQDSVRSRYMGFATQLCSEELEDLSRWPAKPNYIDPHIYVPAGTNTCNIGTEVCAGSIAWTSDGTPGGTVEPPGTPGAFPVKLGPVSIAYGPNPAQQVSYFDSIYLSSGGGSTSTNAGQMMETYEMPCTSPSGNGNYVTLIFSPNGRPPSYPAPCATTPPPGMTYQRQWVIEQDVPVVGVRRVTVLVTLMDLTVQPPLTFQMSMVRP